MNIGALGQSYQSEFRKADSAAKADKARPKPVVSSDTPSISSKAAELSKSTADISAVTAQIAQLPDIRAEKVQAAREKIASGHYESADVIEVLADKMARSVLLP
jgi:flagellar biosynthesis anti-sigma factor FlgM